VPVEYCIYSSKSFSLPFKIAAKFLKEIFMFGIILAKHKTPEFDI
jgi:hypothetical protein